MTDRWYEIDWEKVKSVKDLKVILKAMDIQFSGDVSRYAKDYLVESKLDKRSEGV